MNYNNNQIIPILHTLYKYYKWELKRWWDAEIQEYYLSPSMQPLEQNRSREYLSS